MKAFLKTLVLFCIPGILYLVIMTGVYCWSDPFQILYSYPNYSRSHIPTNWDYISTEMYLKNNERYHYNSFVFGSSRTMAFQPDSWKKYLGEQHQPYMFHASMETVYGIYKKLKFLDDRGAEIKNALIILCRDCSFSTDGNLTGHLYIKDPATSGESRLAFHREFLGAFFNPFFSASYFYFTLTKSYRKWMKGYVEEEVILFDTVTNQVNTQSLENRIRRDPVQYYLQRASLFYPRSSEKVDGVSRIRPHQRYMLREILRILEKHRTDYRIILSPLYEQVRFSPTDKAVLAKLFGSNLFDFSGKNRFTDAKTNYYEPSHYRTAVGDSILSLVYR